MITHLPLSGIQLGDIGPKFGFNLKDNGYFFIYIYKYIKNNNIKIKYIKFYESFMILDNVRIPLVNMLSKYT